MIVKQFKKRQNHPESKHPDFLYECPHCGSDVYEKDPLIIIDGYAYCLDCERPMLTESDSLNVILAKHTPTEDELLESLAMEEF
jgi:hypothetical protein